MAYIQKTTPPPNRIMNFSLRNFNGGLNNRSQQLQVNEASELINMKFSDDTIMEKRNGQTLFDELTLFSPVTFIDEFKPYNDEDRMIRASDSELYIGNSLLTTVAGKVRGTNFQGMYWFVDGDKIRIYGKFPQEVSTYVKITGTKNPDYTLMELVSPPSDYTPLDGTHVRGVLQVDYTNKKVWYEPCTNEKADIYKGSNLIPEKPKYIVAHGGRLFISGYDKDNDNVYISDFIDSPNPYYFPVKMPLQLPPNSDMVIGMALFDNSVVVGRKEDIYTIQGTTNNPNLGLPTFSLRKINSHTGFANQGLVKVSNNYLFFIGGDGNAYSLGSVNMDEKNLSTTIISKTIDFKLSPFSYSMSDIRTGCSYFFEDDWYVSIKDHVFVYSYRHRSWTVFDSFHARSFYHFDDMLIWGNESGRIAKFSEDYFDFGVPFKSVWGSKYFDMDEANTFKHFREFFLVAHTFNAFKSDVVVRFEIDYEDVKDHYMVDNQIAVYGRAKWGERYINRNIVASIPFVIGRRGRAIKIIISNGYKPSTPVSTYADLERYLNKKDDLLVYVDDESRYYLYRDFTWIPQEIHELNQTMKILQVNGDYELRGKR